MHKDYKSDEDIINELMKTPEDVMDFDISLNGSYSVVRCRKFNGLILGNRAEKCRESGDGYDENVVNKFEKNQRSAKKIK